MYSQLRTILRRATRDENQPLNICVFATHERYDEMLCRTNHNFYAYNTKGGKRWNTKYSSIPKNYTMLNANKGEYQLLPWVDIDLVLSQNKEAQFPIAKQLAMQMGVPLISMEHTLPYPGAPPSYVHALHKRQGDIDVFVTDYNREAWGYPKGHGEINNTGIDVEMFSPDDSVEKRPLVLTIGNDFINRDHLLGYTLWQQTTGYPDEPKLPATVIGDTKGLSAPADTIDELVKAYRTCSIYLNTTLCSSLPTVILEAMACEIPVVTTGTTLIPKLMVKHGHNGFISHNNDPDELRHYCVLLLKDEKLRMEMGKNARQWVIDNFGEQRFIDKWNEIFNKTLAMRR